MSLQSWTTFCLSLCSSLQTQHVASPSRHSQPPVFTPPPSWKAHVYAISPKEDSRLTRCLNSVDHALGADPGQFLRGIESVENLVSNFWSSLWGVVATMRPHAQRPGLLSSGLSRSCAPQLKRKPQAKHPPAASRRTSARAGAQCGRRLQAPACRENSSRPSMFLLPLPRGDPNGRRSRIRPQVHLASLYCTLLHAPGARKRLARHPKG